MTRTLRNSVVVAPAWVVLAFALMLSAGQPAGAQTPSTGGHEAMKIAPTATCQQAEVEDLDRVITFVQDQSWTKNPGSAGLQIRPNTTTCQVVLRVNHLSPDERTALVAGAGPRLVIQYVKDNGRPSRLLFYLWLVFGGSGLIWVFRRTRR